LIDLLITVSSRDREEQSLRLCLSILNGEIAHPVSQEEASLLALASSMLVSSYPKHSATFKKVSDHYFEQTGQKKLGVEDILQGKFIISLTRFRSMLEKRISFQG